MRQEISPRAGSTITSSAPDAYLLSHHKLPGTGQSRRFFGDEAFSATRDGQKVQYWSQRCEIDTVTFGSPHHPSTGGELSVFGGKRDEDRAALRWCRLL